MDPSAAIAAWRERGAHHVDPVRFHFIEALARRAAARHGDARRILDGKLAALLAAYGAELEKAPAAEGSTAPAAPQERPAARGALAELADHIARHAPLHEDRAAATTALPHAASPLELKALRYFKSTWSRLSADHRLTQSQAQVPENAGPLHSHHLVHRALTLMRDLSPEYLHRFMSYVDALSWLEQARGSHAAALEDAARGETPKKPARGMPG